MRARTTVSEAIEPLLDVSDDYNVATHLGSVHKLAVPTWQVASVMQPVLSMTLLADRQKVAIFGVHAAGDRVDSVAHIEPVLVQQIGNACRACATTVP
jgi:hypothetical protein